jgi:hypothetical protein
VASESGTSKASTVTYAPKGQNKPGSHQLTVDGKDWLFVEHRPVEDVPAAVLEALKAEAGESNVETGKAA